MGPQMHLDIVVCKDAADAIAQGYDYAGHPKGEYKPIEIERLVVVLNGTEQGGSTVDLVLVDQQGQKFVTMITGNLIKSIPC